MEIILAQTIANYSSVLKDVWAVEINNVYEEMKRQINRQLYGLPEYIVPPDSLVVKGEKDLKDFKLNWAGISGV